MEFNVAELLKRPVGATISYTIDQAFGPIEGVNESGWLRGQVRLMKTNRSLLAQGDLRTTYRGLCSRCSEPFEDALPFGFEEEFFPMVDILTGRPLPPPPEPEAFTIDARHMLSLAEVIRQSAMLALPMQPTCQAACLGLCPQCGQNRNKVSCACIPTPEASPFAALRALVKES